MSYEYKLYVKNWLEKVGRVASVGGVVLAGKWRGAKICCNKRHKPSRVFLCCRDEDKN